MSKEIGFQLLSDKEKDSYFMSLSSASDALFEGQTVGQYLYAKVSEQAVKLCERLPDEDFEAYMTRYTTKRDDLLKTEVGEDYFKKYISDLEKLRDEKADLILAQTDYLYHFSQKEPEEFGESLQTFPQLRGNALQEKIGKNLCYAGTEAQSHYVVKQASSNPKDYQGVGCYMDEKVALITGYEPKEFINSQEFSYRYEIDKSTFVPNVGLDGAFTNEFESEVPARVIGVEGPFSIHDVCQSKENGGWDIPVYFIPNKDDKLEIINKINELRGVNTSRTNAMKQICEQMPEKLVLLNENKELLDYAKRLDNEKQKDEKQIQTRDRNQKLQERIELEKKRSAILIARGLENPKNQKVAKKVADKKIEKTGQGLDNKDMKYIKAKIISKGNKR